MGTPTDGVGGFLGYILPMTMLGVHAFFIQQVGMESGIDIKFPFCALAAKLRKGRGIIIEEIPMMLSVRECHLNAASRTQREKIQVGL